MFDPSVGRFLQEDPIWPDTGEANPFLYTMNSPTNATDPSGMQPQNLVGPPRPDSASNRRQVLAQKLASARQERQIAAHPAQQDRLERHIADLEAQVAALDAQMAADFNRLLRVINDEPIRPPVRLGVLLNRDHNEVRDTAERLVPHPDPFFPPGSGRAPIHDELREFKATIPGRIVVGIGLGAIRTFATPFDMGLRPDHYWDAIGDLLKDPINSPTAQRLFPHPDPTSTDPRRLTYCSPKLDPDQFLHALGGVGAGVLISAGAGRIFSFLADGAADAAIAAARPSNTPVSLGRSTGRSNYRNHGSEFDGPHTMPNQSTSPLPPIPSPTRGPTPANTLAWLDYSRNWQQASLRDAIRRIAGPDPVIELTPSKVIYRNPTTGLQVVHDRYYNYFRVEDPSVMGSGRYLGVDGKPIPNNVPLLQPGGRVTETGVGPDIRQGLTHFTNSD